MKPGERLQSLDALRGFDMLFICGLATLIVAICELFPNGGDCWLALQMDHVDWHGWRHHDTIFPLFLFIAGISFPFSYAKRVAAGTSRGRIYLKIFSRALILVILGIVRNGFFNLDFTNLRLASVLGHIGIAWMFAALIFINTRKSSTRLGIVGVILIAYWLVMRFVPVPGAPAGYDHFSFEYNLAGYVDRMLLPGRLWEGTFDPEGFLSTIPAIATALLGMLTGEFVRIPDEKISGNRKVVYMFAAAAVMLGLGLLWSKWFPINKKLWTSSFVLVVGAYSLGMFSLFYWLIDVKLWRKWAFPMKVVGMNSILIYMAPGIINLKSTSKYFFAAFANLFSKPWETVIMAAAYLLIVWLFVYFFYKQKIFLKV